MSTREYKYFLLLHGGEDLQAMRAGAALFVGEHDFRNFCKVLASSGDRTLHLQRVH